MRRRRVFLTGLLLLSGCIGSSGVIAETPRVVAYVASWSVPATIPADKLTHINYAFAHIDAGGHAVFDNPRVAAGLNALEPLRKSNPKLKILVSIGGWSAEGFSDAALTEKSRTEFSRSVIQMIHQYNLDGVDLDWEYPGQGVAGIKFRAA